MTIETGDETVEVQGLRRQAILTALALAAGERVALDSLVEQVWAEDAPKSAATSLRGHVARLRSDLGDPGLLTTADGGYRLDVAEDSVDVFRFRQRVDRGRQLLAQRRFQAAREVLEAALAEWHDPAMPALRELASMEPVVQQLERQHDELILDLAEARLRTDGEAADVTAYEQLVEQRPYDEHAWKLLMTALYWVGRQSDALAAYQRARQALDEQMGLEPGPALVELEAAILNQEPAIAPPQRMPLDLPKFATSFVGRDDQVREIAKAVGEKRLVTITGLGGAGKTRLAAEVARAAAGDFPDGVVFVPFEQLSVAAPVAQHLTEVLNADGSDIEAVIGQLGRSRLLLVLDSAEHLVERIAWLAGQLLARCPNLVVLATSRLSLGLQSEVVWPIPLMELPEEGAASVGEIGDSEAVRLFLERAATARQNLRLTPESAPLIAQICRLTSGMPLAIELAAARCDVLPLDEIRDRLGQGGSGFSGSEPDRPERHSSIETTVQWTLDLLGSTELALFRRLAVFRDPFAPAVVERVCAFGPVAPEGLLDALGALVGASLLQVDAAGEGIAYRLLEPIRQTAEQLLKESGEEPALRDRHLAEIERRVAQVAGDSGASVGADDLGELDAVPDDIRAALQHAMGTDPEVAARMCVHLNHYWTQRRLHREARQWVDQALEGGSDLGRDLQADLHVVAGWLALELGDLEAARLHTGQAVALHEELDDQEARAKALLLLGAVVSHAGDHVKAREHFLQALGTFRELGHEMGIVRASFNTGVASQKLDRLEEADEYLAETLETSRRAGLRPMEALALERRSFVAAARGDSVAAAALTRAAHQIRLELAAPLDLCRSHWSLAMGQRERGRLKEAELNVLEAVRLTREGGFVDAWWIPGLLELAAAMLHARDEPAVAARLLGAASSLRQRSGLEDSQQSVHDLEEVEQALRSQLGDDRFETERTVGGAHSGQVALRQVAGAFGG